MTVALYCLARILTETALSFSEEGQLFLDRTRNSPAFGVSRIFFPRQTLGFEAIACNASASATIGRLESPRIARRALCASRVLTTPHPRTSASALELKSLTILGSGKAEAQATVMRSGE